jgi:dihydrodipicolinate synthase/N-acetylneuraminate lyase
MPSVPQPAAWVRRALRDGLVIPAHPLVLTRSRKFDERRQRALTRYYHAAGAGGVAVGVHTTQFEIRLPQHGLFKPVLALAASTVAECDTTTGRQTVLVGGICGKTKQALAEAQFAREARFHAGLLSLAAFAGEKEDDIIEHCTAVAHEIPIFGFYLQPAVGGRVFSVDFWRRFAELPNVVGIKIAAFNRYHTFDVVRAVAEVGRAGEIALYTGNDDNIVVDLLTEYELNVRGRPVRSRMVGGLLGHWACWTSTAVRVLEVCKARRRESGLAQSLLTLAAQVTDCNAAFFDAAHQFAGCIAGIHEVLRRQGLLDNLVCLDPNQRLSPGQRQEIERVWRSYPELNDDEFVRKNLDNWLDN